MNKSHNRIEHIDGIRGIASIFVILCHLSCVFLPELYFLDKAHSKFDYFWLNTPLNVITNGNTAVHCFFVLSGFLITKKIYQNSKVNSPIKEYIKFVRLIAPAILFSALLMVLGLMWHLQAATVNPTLNFVNSFNNFTPTPSSILKDILFNTFAKGSMYVGPFWTIRFEFYGTILISAISFYAYSNQKISKIIYITSGFIFCFISPNIVSFIIGAFVFDCSYQKDTDISILDKITNFIIQKKIIISFLFFIGLYFACTNLTLSGLWSPLKYIQIEESIFRALGIGICVLYIENSLTLRKLLSIKLLSWLGRISAYTYAFHWPITLSVGCGSYLFFIKYMTHHLSALVSSLFVILVTLLVASVCINLKSKLNLFNPKNMVSEINIYSK